MKNTPIFNIFKKLQVHYREVKFMQFIFRYVKIVLYLIPKLDIFYRFDYERILTKKFEELFYSIPENAVKVGNYFILESPKLDKSSIVYSLGVGKNIDFDKAILFKYGCDIYLFDPTPSSSEFIKTFVKKNEDIDKKLKYLPIGVWNENKILRFSVPRYGGSASAVFSYGSGEEFDAECQTLKTIMKRLGHTRIDLIKMDIEGAALPVVENMIAEQIFPAQLIAEFERPVKNIKLILDFFYRLQKACSMLENQGYQIYRLPRSQFKYYSVELIFFNTKLAANNEK